MDINNSLLMNTLFSKISNGSYKKEEISHYIEENVENLSEEDAIDSASIGGKTISLFGDVSDEKIMAANVNKVPTIKFATTYSYFSPAEIDRIKTAIYKCYVKGEGQTTPSSPSTTPPTTTPVSEPTSTTTFAFTSSFNSVDTMFDYIHTINPEITKTTGITKAQLTQLAVNNERMEEENQYFFGSLNRAYASRLASDKITYEELITLFDGIAGEDSSCSIEEYRTKVQNLADQIEEEYKNLSIQEKLNFVIAKTRQYLVEEGLQNQLDALNRLLESDEDIHGEVHDAGIGQIAVSELINDDPNYITLGGYNYWYVPESATEVYAGEGGPYSCSQWWGDEDGEQNDNGIVLNKLLFDKTSNYYAEWYKMVNTLVHELTHATAYKYYVDGGNGGIDEIAIRNFVINNGLMSQAELNTFLDNQEDITYRGYTVNKGLLYLAKSIWGEYFAYQADADYLDSIAGDVFNVGATTAVSGENEKATIKNHIEEAYNNESYIEPEPNYKWWSYA